MKPVRVQPIILLCIMGFKNNLAQIIIMTRQFVTNKNHVARLKGKVTVRSLTLYKGFNETCSCSANTFVMRGGILKNKIAQMILSMKLVHVRTIFLSRTVGFENNLVQIVIMTKQCVMNKNHVVRSKVSFTVST